MPRHDAFGNEVTPSTGSGGLPGMPESDGPRSKPTPAQRPPARGPDRPRRTNALVTGIAVTVVVGSFMLSLLSPSDDDAEPQRGSDPALTSPEPSDDDTTLFDDDVLADRLTDLEDAGYEDVGFVLLRPDLMTITARREGGRTSLVEVRPTGEPEPISTVPASSLQSFAPISDIDPAVPEKLVRRVRADGRTLQDIDALAISVGENGIEWQTQMRDKTVSFADADGQATGELP